MVFLTLGEAAKVTGKTKGAISKAIKNGRLSAIKNDKGHFQIDPSELQRVYDYRVDGNTEKETQGNPKETHEVNALKQIIEVKDDRIKDLEEDRALIRGLLTDERTKNSDYGDSLNEKIELLRARIEQAEAEKDRMKKAAQQWKAQAEAEKQKPWYKKLFG